MISKLKLLLTLFLLLYLSFPTVAGNRDFSGYLLGRSTNVTGDGLILSNTSNSFGTARSVAMGGAFTSLGADLASLSINPAGLGMYRHTDVSISTHLNLAKTKTTHPTGLTARSGSKSSFDLSNFGIAVNVFESSGKVTSITVGFGINKVGDFNYTSRLGTYRNELSIVDPLYLGMRGNGMQVFDNNPKSLWPGILALNTGFISMIRNADYKYDTYNVSPEAEISQYMKIKSQGNIMNYHFAGGLNVNNRFYLGATLTLQNVFIKRTTYLDEYYDNNKNAADPIDLMFFDQMEKITGIGFNFKLGAIYRLNNNFRFGLTFHSPTWLKAEKGYRGTMETILNEESKNFSSTGYHIDLINYQTPTSLSFGASYTFLGKGVISIDYERRWYRNLQARGEDLENTDQYYNNFFQSNLKGSNVVRLGAEYKLFPFLALRGGFANYGSMLKNNDKVYDDIIAYKTYNISTGIGFSYRAAYLDITYVYSHTDHTKFNLFGYKGYDNNNEYVNFTLGSGKFELDKHSHNIILTLGFRF